MRQQIMQLPSGLGLALIAWLALVGNGIAAAPNLTGVPLDTVDATAPLDDLAAFGEMVGDARIVALGEATHGTREIFQMKHRLLRYLVEEKGFTIFSIEANMPEAFAIDPYVQGGHGNVAALIGGMYFWTWNTHAVRDLVEWMRAHNRSGPAVHFTGFDMQQPYTAAATVWEMAEALDRRWGRSLRRQYRNIRSIEDLTQIGEAVEGRAGELAQIFDAREMAWLRQCLRLAHQGLVSTGDYDEDARRRDRYMAENVAWIAAQNPDSRIVLWAHNSHVSRGSGWMGEHLAARFGEDYLPVGFALGAGRYHAINVRAKQMQHDTLQRPPENSVEKALADAGHELALFDLRDLPADARDWLLEERPMRSIGAATRKEQFRTARVAADYDLIIYIDRSSPARQLPGKPDRPRKL